MENSLSHAHMADDEETEYDVFEEEEVVAEEKPILRETQNGDRDSRSIQAREAPVAYAQTGFPAAFKTPATIFCLGMLLWNLALIFYFVYVHSYLVFTETSPFIGLAITDVPFYAASPAIVASAGTSEIYASFDYYVWMTDYLLLFLPPYVIGVFLFAVINQMRSVGILGVTLVGVFFLLVQLAKAVYWTLIWAGVFGLSCAGYQFCVSHNPGVSIGTPSTQFVVAVFYAYATALLSILLFFIPEIVKSGRLSTPIIFGKAAQRSMAADQTVIPTASGISRRAARGPPLASSKNERAIPPPPRTRLNIYSTSTQGARVTDV